MSHLTVLPEETNILRGSHTTFQVKGQDEFFNPAEITSNVTWSIDQSFGQFDRKQRIYSGAMWQEQVLVTASVNGIEEKATSQCRGSS